MLRRACDHFLRFTDMTSRLCEGMAVVLLFGFAALMLAEVVKRGFVGGSLAFSWEISTYAMAAMFFLAAGRTLRTGRHVRVSLLLEASGPKTRRVIDLLATLAGLILAIVILVALFNLASASWSRGLRSATYTATPLAWPQALMAVGALQFSLDLCARLIRLVRGQAAQETAIEELDLVERVERGNDDA